MEMFSSMTMPAISSPVCWCSWCSALRCTSGYDSLANAVPRRNTTLARPRRALTATLTDVRAPLR